MGTKIIYRSFGTGKLYETDKDQHFLKECPKCNNKNLFWNVYNELKTVNVCGKNDKKFGLRVLHCKQCNDYFFNIK